ncbi:FecR family protein [Maribellus maritimus]|uniref:FecR family protein n=1 Tax=Maribellus maritimus TaxID=2870838 RepID=UPI001EEC1342|nr:FecR domain-containing protein [Maribellus maritimus]MCG6190679.1 FecR domain-containing protein [Maribellus maritimus]
MKISSDKIDNLIARCISGNASAEEINILNDWLDNSSENKKFYKKNVEVWEKSNGWLSDSSVKQDKFELQKRLTSQLAKQIRHTKRISFVYKIAAILVIPITFAISFYFLEQKPSAGDEQTQICEIAAPKGHVSKCILPDGSEVWINTNSSIIYHTNSFNKRVREVELNGEAYFEVTKNNAKPFMVKTEIANINVTGTSFNVKAYPKEKVFETVLAEGSIEMELNNQSHQKVKLVPGERAIYEENKKGISIEKTEADFYTSWRNGEILFKDATLNDLIKELERIYDIKFHLKNPSLGEFRFRGMFSYNANLIEALEKIKRTAGINYYIENKEVWLTKNN